MRSRFIELEECSWSPSWRRGAICTLLGVVCLVLGITSRFGVPVGLILIVYGVFDAGMWWYERRERLERRRRDEHWACIQCGYDLTTLPSSAKNRCPECGVCNLTPDERAKVDELLKQTITKDQ